MGFIRHSIFIQEPWHFWWLIMVWVNASATVMNSLGPKIICTFTILLMTEGYLVQHTEDCTMRKVVPKSMVLVVKSCFSWTYIMVLLTTIKQGLIHYNSLYIIHSLQQHFLQSTKFLRMQNRYQSVQYCTTITPCGHVWWKIEYEGIVLGTKTGIFFIKYVCL